MKKEPEYKILDDPEVAKVYAVSAARRNKRIAKIEKMKLIFIFTLRLSILNDSIINTDFYLINL